MKVSVVIPAHNSAATIEATLDSVISQTASPHEILVMDDGSTDHTVELLARYQGRITILQKSNQGVAKARNVLCRHAQGDLIAFLDHDDLWHPDYLAVQQKLFGTYPQAAAFFTGHENFHGYGGYQWKNPPNRLSPDVEVIAPLNFLERYHRTPGPFASMSFCCIPKMVLNQLGEDPFCAQVSGVDDFHLFHRLLLAGSIVYGASPLVAYRITSGAQSANLLKAVEKAILAFELLKPCFDGHPDARLRRAFNAAFSGQRREYAKMLMGARQPKKAREQLWISMTPGNHPVSLMKSLALLTLTRVPSRFQPRWPSEWKASHSQ
jgi:glycosyltransferase involved in cell wall biosynthesis